MLKSLELLAEEVRSRRKQAGLSQEEFAEKAGISMALVSELERGIANPTLQTLEKIAGYFQTTISEMLGSADNSESINLQKINIITIILRLDRQKLEKVSKFLSKL